jgi:S-DNA-T family DNA segregation ATPase FtsK/SpoIIIE
MTQTQPEPQACRGCHRPVEPGFYWHRDCLAAYRAKGDYRRRALKRDGYACASCSRARNWLVLADPRTGQLRLPAYAWKRPSRTRRVDVDHIRPIGGAVGTHAGSNLQVLCAHHHAAKTRIDVAELKGRKVARRRTPARVIAALAGLALVLRAGQWLRDAVEHSPDPEHTLRLVGPVVVGLAVGVLAGTQWRRYRQRVLTRLHESLATVTGASATEKRSIRVHRWGKIGHRLVPVDFTLTYPHTFEDSDPDAQTKIENRVRARLGFDSMVTEWVTPDCQVRMTYPDPFVDAAPIAWPWAAGGQRSLWDPIPVGVDRKGQPCTVSLIEQNVLLGGLPGRGKSVGQSQLTAAGALDPDCKLLLVDGKRVELIKWAAVAEAYVTTAEEFIALLGDLQMELDLRYEVLASQGRRKIEKHDGMGLIMLVIDELAFFTATGPRAQRDQIEGLLRDIISRGRACGVIVSAATQRPSADVVPTNIRDIVGVRWAMGCATPTSSDMVLGAGKAAEGFSASKIDGGAKGTGYLLTDEGRPTLMRSYLITDADLDHLAAEAYRIRNRRVQLRKPAADGHAQAA